MLENIPRNYISIRDLIDDYLLSKSKNAKKILLLLECTKNFILETAPDCQEEREKFLTDEKIKNILNEAARGLQIVHSLPKNEFAEIKDVLAYCKLAILERLELLQRNKDKIFYYYAHNQNELKSTLVAMSQF